MAYYSGQVSSYSDLISVIHTACLANGYSLNNGILSKDQFFIQLIVGNANEVESNPGPGILLKAARGASGSNLIDAIENPPRIGSPNILRNRLVWPATYHIHINGKNSEVFIALNYNIDCFYWGGWGVSDLKYKLGGSGNWVSAISSSSLRAQNAYGEIITPTGDASASLIDRMPCQIFGDTAQTGNQYAQYKASRLDHGIAGAIWSSGGICSAISNIEPLFQRSPNVWNSESVLLPITVATFVASNKHVIVANIDIARYVRIDNYNPLQVITLGGERWKIYPAYKKNSESRDGGAYAGHSGTIGMAVRYDGP